MPPTKLGSYLRARRELVRPEHVGIRDSSRRRVPGLRRDELAMLAGISTEYYTRLEQGRDRHPSAQVLDAVARALALDGEATAHLQELAREDSPARPRRRRTARRPEVVPPSVLQLLAVWHATPAYVHGRHMDVLAANQLASALTTMFTPGTNVLRAIFLDPAVRDLFDDWEARLGNVVAGLRAAVGPNVDDPRLTELVGELSINSDAFRRLWARHDVRAQVGDGIHRMHHPQVGPLELRYDKFAIAGADDQTLVVYHADPASPSEQALMLLTSIAAEPRDRSMLRTAPAPSRPASH